MVPILLCILHYFKQGKLLADQMVYRWPPGNYRWSSSRKLGNQRFPTKGRTRTDRMMYSPLGYLVAVVDFYLEWGRF